MKKIGILFLIIVISSYEFTYATSKDSLSNYYGLRNQAELELINKNYPLALSVYKTAFQYKKPNEKDLYNAFIISCILKDSISAKPLFNQLAALGMTKHNLVDDLRQDKIDTSIMEGISGDYQYVRSTIEFAELMRNARFMDTLLLLDQGIRQYATNTYGPIEGIKMFNDSIEKTDSIVLDRMLGFIRREGFPDIYKTGFLATEYRHISAYPMIILLLRHLTNMPSSRRPKTELLNLSHKAVLEGKLDPRDYAFAYDESEGNTYGSVIEYSDYEDISINLPIPDEKLAEINRARKSIFLEPLEQQVKKLEFLKGCYYFYFFNIFIIMHNNAFFDSDSYGSQIRN